MPASPDQAAATQADDALADTVRRRLRAEGVVPIEPDERVRPLLGPTERLVAVRRSAVIERRAGWRNPDRGLHGDLYVTNERLVHLGRTHVECPLGDIRQVVLGQGALLLEVGSRGVVIFVPDPGVLRVEIAAARQAARREPHAEPGPEMADSDRR